MSIRCKNGTEHSHETVAESRACWTGQPAPVASPTAVSPAPLLSADVEFATERQIWRVGKEGGDQDHARRLTKMQCIKYIDGLIKMNAEKGAPVEDPRQKAIIQMLSLVPDGYFAVHPDDETPYTFLRLTRPKKGKFQGTTKVQTQHSDILKPFLTVWPSGKVWKREHTALDKLELLVANYRDAGIAYAREMNHCMSCGKQLTDPRSRHYGVGPECEREKGFDWLIAQIDEQHGHTFEWLFSKGMVS